MSDEDRTVREVLHEAIQSSAALGPVNEGDPEDVLPDSPMLMGFVVVAEWMDGEGHRWLSKVDGDANGQSAASWTVDGYLHNALFDWPDPDDDE